MSAELIDLCAKITAETAAVLQALARSGGKEQKRDVREAVHELIRRLQAAQ